MNHKIENLPLKSICLGRVVVDVPQNTIVTYGPAGITGWKVSVLSEEDLQSFISRTDKIQKDLNDLKNETGLKSLENVERLEFDGKNVRIFVFDRIKAKIRNTLPQEYSEAVTIDAFVHMENITYQFKGQYNDPSDVSRLEHVIKKMRPRANATVPIDHGFCIDRAIFEGELGIENHEFAVVFLGLKNHPDLAIALSSQAGGRVSPTLLQRDAEEPTKIENKERFITLRQGSRIVNNIPGEEVLDHIREPNGSELQSFMWESIASPNSVHLPKISLELDTGYGRPGEPVNSSLSDIDALALWDKILLSLRRIKEPKDAR